MFERQVAYYLNKYLGEYVQNVDASALSISIWKGNVELSNLQLKPEALNALDLPITVKSGLLGSLKLKVPWSNLGGEPVICQLDRIYVLAVPNTGEKQSTKDFLAAEQHLKQEKVDQAEREFIRLWQESLHKKEDEKRAGQKDAGEEGQQGMLRSYIDTILGNLQISITNVHIRYEDQESIPGQVFSCGLTLQEASAFTVNKDGDRTFVSVNALEHLRKTATLRRLALYFDVETQQYQPPTEKWKTMARTHWDSLFLAGIGEDDNVADRQYLFWPINGQMAYERLDGKQRKKLPESEPTQMANLALMSVDLHLSERQLHCIQALLEAISMHNQRAPHIHLRPLARPSGRAAVQRWWQYAAKAIVGEGKYGKLSWKQIRTACRDRREYIPLYVECLKQGKVGGNQRVKELDANLSIGIIIHFRKISHMKLEKEKRVAALQKYEEEMARPGGQGRGWINVMGWSIGGSKPKPPDSLGLPGGDSSSDATFSGDEVAQFQSMIEEQRQAALASDRAATPYTVKTCIKLSVTAGSIALSDNEGVEIVKAAMEDFGAQSKMYPTAIEADLSVGQIHVSSAEDVLMTSRTSSSEKSSTEVFSVNVIHKPQDGRADDVVELMVQPTYITYNGGVTDRILDFVARQQHMNLGAIGANARVVAGNMATEVKTAVVAAWDARDTPKLLVNLTMEAPKIALPIDNGAGSTAETLLLDMGRFMLETDRNAANALSADELLVYECLALRGSYVQAYILQGSFDWERWEDMRAGGSQSAAIPLYDPIELQCGFQYAKSKHPTLPSLCLKVTVPQLCFHVSPARLALVMRLLKELSGHQQQQLQGAPAWFREIDFDGDLKLMTWSGVSFSNATWVDRWAAIWYGWLYIMERRESYAVIRSVSVFDRHVLKVPSDMVGGLENVVALCTESKLTRAVIERPDTVVVRFPTADLESDWIWRLHLAKQRMAVLLSAQHLDHTGGVLEEGVDGEAMGVGNYSSLLGLSGLTSMLASNPEDALRQQESKISLEAVVDIGNFQLAVSGRSATAWWPPEDLVAPTDTDHEYKDEAQLVVICGQGMRADYKMSPTHLEMSSSLSSLVVEDKLVGPQRSDCRYLAVSNKSQLTALESDPTGKGVQIGESEQELCLGDREAASAALSTFKSANEASFEDDEFFDALERMSTCSQMSEGTLNESLTKSTSFGLGGFDLGDSSPDAQETDKLAHVAFKLIKPESPLYEGVDTEATVKVATLFVFCNRPTVAALMVLGGDMGQAAAVGNDAPPAEQPAQETGAYDAEAGMIVKGDHDRITFRLHTEMQTLSVTMNYEGQDACPLLEASMKQFSFDLDVKPQTLQLESRLGNLIAEDKSFGNQFPNSIICDLRPEGGINSLIELQYSTHQGGPEPQEGGRVPVGMKYSRVQAKLNAVDVVFLNRQVQEMLAYINGLMALQPEPLSPLPSSPVQPNRLERAGSSRLSSMLSGEMVPLRGPEAPQGLLILLDVDMQAPVMTMPLSSFSTDAIVVDLGHLQLSNGIVWQERDGQQVLVDQMDINISGISTTTYVDGDTNRGLVQFHEEGFHIVMNRLLAGDTKLMPGMEVDLTIPEVSVHVKDQEFHLILSITQSNLSEELNQPPAAVWLNDEVTQPAVRANSRMSSGPASAMAVNDDRLATWPAIKVTINLCRTHLQLLTTTEGYADGTPLASMLLPGMTVDYKASQSGMNASVAIPHITVRDLRTSTPDNSRLVMSGSNSKSDVHSTGQEQDLAPSMVLLEYVTNVTDGSQDLNFRLQRPTFIAEMGFVLALSSFVSSQKDCSHEYLCGDVLLACEVTRIKADLWLSPSCRLLADGPGADDYVLDGCGMRLILPKDVTQEEPLPLIFIGAGKSLRLCNFHVFNSRSLAGSLHLGQGAQLVALEDDGVIMDPEDVINMSMESRASKVADRWLSFRTSDDGGEGLDPAERPNGRLCINLTAIGMSLNFLDIALKDSAGLKKPANLRRIDSRPAFREEERSTYMLTTSLDISMTYMLFVSGEQKLDADLRDVVVEAFLEQAGQDRGDDLGMATVEPPGYSAESLSATNTILRPCNITFKYHVRKEPRNATEINLETSDLVFTVGVDMLDSLARLKDRVLGPLSAPPPERPLATAMNFTKVWPADTDLAMGMPPYANPRDVDVFKVERNFSVWRPKVPAGYVSLGDVITQGSELPRHQAACIARDCSLVSSPSDFHLVLSEGGLYVWSPLPPEGFVALGCVCTTTEDPPHHRAVACVHKDVVVQAAPAECLCIRTRTAPAQESGETVLQHLKLWTVSNSPGTFVAIVAEDEDSSTVPGGTCYDLRAPLGIAPAALHKQITEIIRMGKLAHFNKPNVVRYHLNAGLDQPEEEDSSSRLSEWSSLDMGYDVVEWDVSLQRELAYSCVRNISSLKIQRTQDEECIEVAEFKRVWVRGPARERASFWRPVLPLSYVSLGDCMTFSQHPPKVTTAFLDDSVGQPSHHGMPLQSHGSKPKFAVPVSMEMMWKGLGIQGRSSKQRPVSLWRPLAPSGYVAVGWVAWEKDGSPTPESCSVRCIRSDLLELQPESGSQTVIWQKPFKGNSRKMVDDMCLWNSNNYLSAFWGSNAAVGGVPTFTWTVVPMSDETSSTKREREMAEDPHYQITVETGLLSMMLLGISREPLIELNLAGAEALQGRTQAGYHGRHSKRRGCSGHVRESAPGLLRGFFEASMEIWSYNKTHWEPVMEPFGILTHFHHNSRSRMVSSYSPGTHLNLTPTSEALHLTVAHSALESLLQAYNNTSAAAGSVTGTDVLASARNSTRYAFVENKIGTRLEGRVEYQHHHMHVSLEPSERKRVLLLRSLDFSRRRHVPPSLPKGMLVVDVDKLALGPRAGRVGALSVCLELLPAPETKESVSIQTRWLKPSGNTAQWQEQLLVNMQDEEVTKLAEIVSGKNDDDMPNLAISCLTLRVTVIDVSADSGRGARVASGATEIPYVWLLDQIQRDNSPPLEEAVELSALGSVELPASFGQVDISLLLEWTQPMSQTSPSGLDDLQAGEDSASISTIQLRMGESDPWSSVSNSSTVRRGAVETSALVYEEYGMGAHPVIITPVVVHAGAKRKELALEESLERGIRKLSIRSLCQVANHTSVTLEVGLLRGEGPTGESSHRSASGFENQLLGKKTVSRMIEGEMQTSVVEQIFENERYTSVHGFGSAGCLSLQDEREGHRRYEWVDMEGNWQCSYTFPSIPAPPGWRWVDDWHVETSHQTDKSDGYIYGSNWDELTFPPKSGMDQPRTLSMLRRRLYTRTRVEDEAGPADDSDSVEILGRIPPWGRLPLPLGWDHGDVRVVMRPVLDAEPVDQESSAQDSPDAAPTVQLTDIAHKWSIAVASNTEGLTLTGMVDEATFMLACPPTAPLQGAIQLQAPHKTLRKFTAFKGLMFWLSARLAANPFSTASEGLIDWDIVVAPPLVLENLLPVDTEFYLWEKPSEAGSLKLRCEGSLASGGSVQVHVVDMRHEVQLSMAPETCSREGEPVVIYPGAERPSMSMATNFEVSHTGHSCRTPLMLYLERRTFSQVLDNDPKVMASVARGAPMAVSVFSSLVVLNATQLPLFVSVERTGKIKKRLDQAGTDGQAEPEEIISSIGVGDAPMPVQITPGLRHGMGHPPGCRTLAGTVQMMSYPILSEYEYGIKVALEGSTATSAISLDSDVANSSFRLRAQIGNTQQIHEAVVTVLTCRGAFGRTKLVKLEPYIVVSNLTGFPLQLLQCTKPEGSSPAGGKKARDSLRGPDAMLMQAAQHIADGGKDAVRQSVRNVRGTFQSAKTGFQSLVSKIDSSGSPPAGNTPGSSAGGHKRRPYKEQMLTDAASREHILLTSSVRHWPTDDLGVMELPPGAVAAPFYWSERCWQYSLAIRLLDASGSDPRGLPMSSPFQLRAPGFEEQQLRLPVKHNSSADSSSVTTDEAAPGGSGNTFTTTSTRSSAIKLRSALAGSPSFRALADHGSMHECYLDEEAVVVKVSATLKRSNSLHLVFHSINSEAPASVENRSPETIIFRRAGLSGLHWQVAHPWTSVPLAWDFISREAKMVELSDLTMIKNGTRKYSLAGSGRRGGGLEVEEADGLEDPGGSTAGASGWSVVDSPSAMETFQSLPCSGATGSCRVQLVGSGLPPHPMAGGGVMVGSNLVGARSLGTCNRLQALVISASHPQQGTQDRKLSNLQPTATRIDLFFKLQTLDISIVDHIPQELILLTVNDLTLDYASGLGPNGTFNNTQVRVDKFQVDNMLPYTRYPVLAASVATKEDRDDDPFFEIVLNQEQSSDRIHLYYPYIYTKVNKTLVISMCEALFWNALAMYQNLTLPAGSNSSQEANVQADTLVHISRMSVGDMRTRLSFGTAPDARANAASSSAVSFGYLFSLAAFKDLDYQMRGWTFTDRHTTRSHLVSDITSMATSHILSIAFRILRANVSLSSASRAIGGVSSQVAKLSMDDDYKEIRNEQAKQEVRHIGEGFLDGGEAFAKSLVWGLTGIVRRPLQGAQQSGAMGFMEGLGTGVVGAVVQPVSGMLDMVSKTAEGAGASFDKVSKVLTGDDVARPKLRRRLPRAISGDQCLQPFNQQAAEGQNLLWRAKRAPGLDEIFNMRFRAVQVSKYIGDKYEAHLRLPASRVALITNCRVMLLSEPSSRSDNSEASGSANTGRINASNNVQLEWECEWDDVLSFQLKRSRAAPVSEPPDRLVLYRKEGGPNRDMQHEWRCLARTPQAEQLYEMVQATRLKYCEAYRQSRALPPQNDLNPTSARRGITGWCTGPWKLIWRRNSGGRTVSIYRPLPAEGYMSTGDVLVEGVSAPLGAVSIIRNDLHLFDGSSKSVRRLPGAEAPLVARPTGYWLVWRTSGKGTSPAHIHSGEGALSLWLPVAPSDRYRAIGCVAMPSLEEPPLSLGVCVRRDLLQPTHLESCPLWKGTASDNTGWPCKMWRIANSTSQNFFASRTNADGFRFYCLASELLEHPSGNQ